MGQWPIDASLVPTLLILLEQRHVTRAAGMLDISQSTMSHRLNQLRNSLKDELLVRSGDTMLLTPRAESLLGPLRDSVEAVSRALAPPTAFLPAQSEMVLRLVLPDLLAPFLPGLASALMSAAPRLRLEFLPVPGELSRAFHEDSCSLAIAPQSFADPQTMKRSLGKLHFGVVTRKSHPSTRCSLNLESWLSYRHVVVSMGQEQPNVIDEWLKRKKLQREVGLRVPNFLAGLLATSQSDLVMNAPQPLAAQVTEQFDLLVRPAPVRLPSIPLALMWHPRYQEDAAHAWARNEVYRYLASSLMPR